MLMIESGKFARRFGAMVAVLALSSGAVFAGDHGYSYHAKVHQHGTLVTPSVGTVGTVVYSSNVQALPTAGMAMVAVPQVTTHYLVTTAAPTYYTTYTAGVAPTGALTALPNTASSLLQPSPGNVAPPMLKSASASTSASTGQATVDYVSQYNQFLQQENLRNPGSAYVAAGVRTNPSDIALFNQNHPQLTAYVGADRLGSIGRFLLQKLNDPNFRNNAIKLFEPILGTLLPQFAPLINNFLNDLIQASGQGNGNGPLQPLPQPETSATGGTFDATGVVNGRIVLTPVTGPTPPPPPPNTNPPGTLPPKLKDDGSGGSVAPSP
jgi:hypothetical protein